MWVAEVGGSSRTRTVWVEMTPTPAQARATFAGLETRHPRSKRSEECAQMVSEVVHGPALPELFD